MATTTIYARNDCYVDEANPDTSYESATSLRTQVYSGEINRSFIEFSLDDMPRPYCNITSLDLYLYIDGRTIEQSLIDFNWLSDYNWNPAAVTWNNQLNVGSTDFTTTTTGLGWWNKDIVDYISYLNTLYSYIGYQIKYDAETGTIENTWASMERVPTGWRPYLSIVSSDWITQITSDSITYDPGWELPPWWKGHAKEIYYTDHNVGYSEFELKVILPWNNFGSAHTTISALSYQTWSSTYSSGSLRWRCYIFFATSGSPPTIRIYEQYWTVGDLYVKTTGNDSLDGRSWDNAFKTVDRAANIAIDGQEVHIGFGTYNNEPANNDIAPVNFGTTGIKYTPETAGTGGGTGTVTVERN